MSKLQDTVALSTTEVEYIASSHACKEAIWLEVYLEKLEGCITMCLSSLTVKVLYIWIQSKTKYIDVKYHFVRQAISEGGVDLKKVHTK